MKNLKPILLVEDDYVDALTVTRALKELKVPNKLIHLQNGEEALDYLQDKQQKKPCIILLDLNMPRMNGLEFLKAAKEDENIRSIPIVILTTSTEHQDRHASFDLSVAGYMIKPVDYNEFVGMMETISNYWTNSELPN